MCCVGATHKGGDGNRRN